MDPVERRLSKLSSQPMGAPGLEDADCWRGAIRGHVFLCRGGRWEGGAVQCTSQLCCTHLLWSAVGHWASDVHMFPSTLFLLCVSLPYSSRTASAKSMALLASWAPPAPAPSLPHPPLLLPPHLRSPRAADLARRPRSMLAGEAGDQRGHRRRASRRGPACMRGQARRRQRPGAATDGARTDAAGGVQSRTACRARASGGGGRFWCAGRSSRICCRPPSSLPVPRLLCLLPLRPRLIFKLSREREERSKSKQYESYLSQIHLP